MIIYFYLFIPLVCRLAESSSIKGRNRKNELVPFLSSSLDPQKKDNSLKIVSNEPFIIQFQMPQQELENIDKGVKSKDKKQKRQNKKRVSKTKPMRKKIRKRRDLSEAEPVEEKPHEMKKPLRGEKIQDSHNKTHHPISRLDILKALHSHALKQETKKHRSERMKTLKEKTDVTSVRNYPTSSPDSHAKTMYLNTPKTEFQNYSYKDLIADRERLEQKINYIKNLLHINDTSVVGGRVRRRSDSDKNANKLAKMFLTLSAANASREKRKPRCRDNEERTRNYLDRVGKGRPTRVSNNEERFMVKKWIEMLKEKRSGKTCTCMEDGHNEENDVFPLELKLSKGSQLGDTDTSGEDSFDNMRDSLARPGKNGNNRNSYREDVRSKLRALANNGKRKYELPLDDLEVYRTRAKQILQNAEEILDKIKEEEERRLAAPSALVSQLKEITSRIQGDPRNNENDLIRIIQKNLGWNPQSNSQSDTLDAEGKPLVENVKSLIFDPFEKAKELTDENTKKITTYLLRNLGKIGFSEDEEEIGKSDQSSQVYHGQVPQTEEMFSANLAKENPESDSYSKFARGREEVQNWSDTLSALLGGNDDDVRKENTQEEQAQRLKNQEDMLKKRMEEMIKEQEKKVKEYPKTSEKEGNTENEDITTINLMTEEGPESQKFSKSEDEMLELSQASKNEGKSNSAAGNVPEETVERKPELVSSSTDEPGSDVVASEYQQLVENEKFDESAREETDETEGDKILAEPPMELEVKAATGENTPKEDETIAEYIENAEDKSLESPKADENQGKDSKDVIMAPAEGSEKEKSDENTDQILKSSEEIQDDKIEAKGEREDNDVTNSRHLVPEEPGRNEDEKMEELTEDIKKVVDENSKENSEKTLRQEKPEDDIMEENSSETEPQDEEKDVSSDSVALEKQTETAFDGTKSEISLEDNDSSSGVLQASQDSKESTEYDNSKKDASSEKETSDDSFVENETVEKKEEKMEESEDSDEKSGEKIAEKSDVLKSEKEKMDDAVTEKEESVRKEAEDDTSKDVLEDSRSEEVEEESETVKEKSNADDTQEKEILKESVDEIEAEGDDQAEASVKASLDDTDNKEESEENKEEDKMDENVEESLRSENSEKDMMEESSEKISLKASQKNEDEGEEEEKENKEEVLAKESNADEVQGTELDNEENEGEPEVKAVQTKDEEIEEAEKSRLRSENPDDTEKSNEGLMNASKSEETVKTEEDETMDVEKIQGSYDKTEKATSDEGYEKTEEIESAEDENVEKQTENESVEENAREVDENETEESAEASKSPKIVMSIKEGLEAKKSNEEGDEANTSVGDTLNTVEEDDDDQPSANEEGSLREANPEAGEELDTQEVDDKEELNVQAEEVKDFDNYVDGVLRSEDEESEEVEEGSIKEKNNANDDGVEGSDKVKDKQDETVQFAPVSEERENSEANLLKSSVKVPKSIGNIMRSLDGKEKDFSLTNLNPEKIDNFIEKIDEEEQKIKMENENVDCRKECACADKMDTRSRNSGRYEIVKDFLYWMKDLHLNQVLNGY